MIAFGQFFTAHFNEFDRALYNYSIDISHGINVNVYGDLSLDIETFVGKGKSFPFAVGRSFLQLTRMDGTVISKSRDLGEEMLPCTPEILHNIKKAGVEFRTITA